MPTLVDSEKVILDLGCSIGQTFIALDCVDNRTCIGLDIDDESITYALYHYGNNINFILLDTKKIPLPAESLNLVTIPVSLPYTNIPRVVKEIKRALKNHAHFWKTLDK